MTTHTSTPSLSRTEKTQKKPSLSRTSTISTNKNDALSFLVPPCAGSEKAPIPQDCWDATKDLTAIVEDSEGADEALRRINLYLAHRQWLLNDFRPMSRRERNGVVRFITATMGGIKARTKFCWWHAPSQAVQRPGTWPQVYHWLTRSKKLSQMEANRAMDVAWSKLRLKQTMTLGVQDFGEAAFNYHKSMKEAGFDD